MNKYEIIGIVGEGAYGVVYKAKCKETGEFGKYTTSYNQPDTNQQVSVLYESKALVIAKINSK